MCTHTRVYCTLTQRRRGLSEQHTCESVRPFQSECHLSLSLFLSASVKQTRPSFLYPLEFLSTIYTRVAATAATRRSSVSLSPRTAVPLSIVVVYTFERTLQRYGTFHARLQSAEWKIVRVRII